MANRALIVEIVGDDRKLQQTFVRSVAGAKKFGNDMDKVLKRPSRVSSAGAFEGLLGKTRENIRQADELRGRLDNLDEGFQGAARGASVLDGGLLKVAGRVGLLGLAVNTAYQASNKLQDALTQTGKAAFTTEGRLKNAAAALLNADIIGAVQALRDQPDTLEELGISAVEAANRMEALQIVASGTALKIKEQGLEAGNSAGALRSWGDAVKEAGTGNQRLAQELINQVAALRAAETAQNALADATARLGSVFVTSTGQAVTFKGAVDDLGGLRGPGAVDAINAILELNKSTSGKLFTPIGPTAKNEAAQVIAQANEDLDELLRLQTIQRDRLQKVFDNATGNVAQRTALNAKLVAAQAAVIATQKTIQETADAARKQKAKDASAAFLAGLDLGIAKAENTAGLRDDLNALLRMRAGLEKQIRAGMDIANNQSRLQGVIGEIASKRQEISDKARDALQARQFRAIGLSVTGDELIPGLDNLRKQFEQLDENIVGKDIPSKLRNRMKLIGKFLGSGLKDASPEVRAAIRDFFRDVRGEFDKSIGPLTKTSSLNANKVLEGLGLGRDMEKELRARLSSFNTAGLALAGTRRPTGGFVGGPTLVVENHNTVQLDSDVVGRNVTKSQQKAKRRNPKQKRGPNSGV